MTYTFKKLDTLMLDCQVSEKLVQPLLSLFRQRKDNEVNMKNRNKRESLSLSTRKADDILYMPMTRIKSTKNMEPSKSVDNLATSETLQSKEKANTSIKTIVPLKLKSQMSLILDHSNDNSLQNNNRIRMGSETTSLNFSLPISN